MSLVIENAYKFNEEMDITTLKEYTDSISKFLKGRLEENLKEEMSKLISLILDFKFIGKTKEEIRDLIDCEYDYLIKGDMNVYRLISNLIERDTNSKAMLHTAFDIVTKLRIYPVNNKVLFVVSSSKNLTKVVANSEDKRIDLITENFPVLEYEYWNNTDKPDEISEEEWSIRAEDWNSIIYKPFNWSVRIDNDLIPTHLLISGINEVIDDIESLYEYRVNLLALTLVNNEISSKIDEDFKGKESNFRTISNAVRTYEKSDFFIKRREDIKKDLYEKLPKSYTIKDIKSLKI